MSTEQLFGYLARLGAYSASSKLSSSSTSTSVSECDSESGESFGASTSFNFFERYQRDSSNVNCLADIVIACKFKR